VGKSTLLNFLVQSKIAAVSPKPQTTRGMVRGLIQSEQGQAVLLDTPGFQKQKDQMGQWMSQQIQEAIDSADLIWWMMKPNGAQPFDAHILDWVKRAHKPTFLLINQIDTVKKEKIIPVIDRLKDYCAFNEIVPISAQTGVNLDRLLACLFQYLPEHPPYFDQEILSPENERDIAAELIREQLYHFTHQELPYATTIRLESFQEGKPVEIEATVLVERESQKGIVIGQNGKTIHQMRRHAEKALQLFLQRPVRLELRVKVMRDWKEKLTPTRKKR